ncbi:tetraacyldisaccharide 4'-kinase [Methylobacterium gossipiicola]|uniref:Tetraacyldisaccharide 4'-kinase n=1 Tax=Methylobacterium gossipiicola TaxID=582675 RepID=A0A1I2UKE0_9HYPH|nr:tetraacyldisaccharide 4'-kinase [Methylobacterium gossipiicola]SFG75306.1 lipid-A-disaccharide kinase [Methylobacterium gossipiicola]
MRPPAFWNAAPGHPAARALAPLAALYGWRSVVRMDRPGVHAPCPVICVGNFTLGGAGKTPTALALATMLRDLGAAPAFLTRGYGGCLTGPVRVEPDRHGAAETGDEPLLLARHAPTVVARDRVAGARQCVALGADVIVMDDGLQNPALAKDLALAVVDAGAGLGNGRVFPAGPLRVSLARQWPHVHGIVLVGDGAPGEAVAEDAARRGLPVHRARLVPGGDWDGRRVLAFAGIGRPEKMFATLRAAGADVAGTWAFPDHHPYRRTDLDALAAEAARLGADLVTTAKDHVRLPPDFSGRVAVLPVTLEILPTTALVAQLATSLRRS